MRKMLARLEPETTDVACTLSAADQLRHRAEFGAAGGPALLGVERAERSMILRFRAVEGLQEALRDLVAREHACCSFARYELSVEGDELQLALTVPEFGDVFLDEIEAAVRGDEGRDGLPTGNTDEASSRCC